MQTETTNPNFDFDFDFNSPDEIDYSFGREYWKTYELQNCGKPKWSVDPNSGEPVVVYFRRCKQFNVCPKCAAWKRKQEEDRLNSIDRSKVKYVEVDEADEKSITRQYGKDKIRRVPLADGRTGFLIETSDIIEGEQKLTKEIAQKLVDNIITSEDGRRPSGNLGKSPSSPPVSAPDENKKEVDWNTPDIVQVKVKECTANFDSDDPNAPKNVRELFRMVHSEVEVYSTPKERRELWDGVNKLQDKAEEICNRYNLSFRFLKVTVKEVNLFEVDWKWTKGKVKIE